MAEIKDLIGNASEFPVLAHWDFFNHAAVAPLPACAANAMRTFCDYAEQHAYLNANWHPQIDALRRSAANLINASHEEIAFIKNTSEGLAFVANGIDWKPGDRIVTTNVEYPANIYPWMDLQKRLGVELIMVAEEMIDSTHQTSLAKILAAADHPKTRLVTLSHVEYGSGQRHDLEAVGRFCRERNILLCVDAIQSLGVVPVDVKKMHIDYLSADSHKWLLGPLGAGMFYIRKDLIENTRPSIVGWMNVINAQDFANYNLTYKPDARRYEPGAQNISGLLGFKAALELLASVGIENISQRVKALGDRLVAGLTDKGYAILSSRENNQWSGSVCFSKPDINLATVAAALRDKHHIEIAVRLGRLRCSPHFYNTDAQIDRLLERLPG